MDTPGQPNSPPQPRPITSPPPSKPSRWSRQNKILAAVAVIWIVGKLIGWGFGIPGPWGPGIGGELPDRDGSVFFQSRQVGRHNEDRLVWNRLENNAAKTTYFPVHSDAVALEFVTLYHHDNDRVWIESEGAVAVALDLENGVVYKESELPQWAITGEGDVLGEGMTWSFIQVIVPW